jgi:hypothetical protein
MKRFSLIAFMSLLFINIYGQQFTEVLQTKSSKGGIVLLVQSSKIDSLVNGLKPKQPIKDSSSLPKITKQDEDSVQLDSIGKPIPKGFVNKDGFRIQIYTGANSRTDKEQALKLQTQSKNLFPDYEVYCNFISPRWVVRIGDFETRDEAMVFMTEVRKTGISKEVRVVKCKVQIPFY